jgi:integrase
MKLGPNKDDNFNWFDPEEKSFYFNNFKTVKTIGSQTLDIPDDLFTVLMNYVEYMDIEEGGFLIVDEDYKPMTNSASITRQFNKIFPGRKLSTSMLRHIFLTDALGDDLEKREELSKAMSHSITTQSAYILND